MREQVFTNEDVEGIEAIDWLFDGHLREWFELKARTVAVTLTGNEDSPDSIELLDLNHYQQPPFAVFGRDAEGELVRTT